jgi:Ca2+:H+ antiporter
MLTSLSARARRLHDLLAKFSLIIGIGLSILFFSLSTVLHFVQRASLAEFLVAIITIVPISSLNRYATQDLVIRLQQNDYELLSGLLNGLFGNVTELCFVLIAVSRRESVIAQTALTGALISSCLMIFGTCLVFGGIQHERQYYPIATARTNAQLLVVSLVSISVPTAFKSWSEGELTTQY